MMYRYLYSSEYISIFGQLPYRTRLLRLHIKPMIALSYFGDIMENTVPPDTLTFKVKSIILILFTFLQQNPGGMSARGTSGLVILIVETIKNKRRPPSKV